MISSEFRLDTPLEKKSSRMRLLMLVCCLLALATGSKIEFVASPDLVTAGLTKTVTLRCSLSDTWDPLAASSLVVGRRDQSVRRQVFNTEHVTSVLLTKLGNQSESIASVFIGGSPVTYGHNGTLQAQGNVLSQPGERAFLEVTWPYPDKQFEGTYECRVNALDDIGQPIYFVQNLTINVTEPSATQLYVLLLEMNEHLEDAEKKISNLETALANANQQISNMASSLALLSPPHSEAGEVYCGPSDSWADGTVYIPVSASDVHTHPGGKYSRHSVLFQRPYASLPAIIVSVSSIHADNPIFNVAVQDVTTTGFTIQCQDWDPSTQHYGHMNVRWMSTVKDSAMDNS